MAQTYSENFNIHAQVQKELDDFFTKKVTLLAKGSKGKAREFSQIQTVNKIEMYCASMFESGPTDSEGQQKIFLNMVEFRRAVASKQVDIDVKDFTFIPDEAGSQWQAFLAQKDFHKWAKETYFGELINDSVERYPKYGTVVLKRVKGKLDKVQLRLLRNQQDAESLKKATYVIEEHPNMTRYEMEEMPDWDTTGINLKYGETETVYERYGCVPTRWYNQYKGLNTNGVDENDTIEVMTVLTVRTIKDPENKNDICTGTVLFCEALAQEDRPYEEAHWDREDGRWLGVGVVEQQFENQKARNMIANMRRKNLYWASKKIFQSSDESIAKNLASDVKDGEVLMMGMNSQGIIQVDTTTKNIGEYQNFENMIEENANQRAFTFEVATGESMPSGTPFRLGVVLSNSVNSHFGMKREKLGLFYIRVMKELVLKDFYKDMRPEHVMTIASNEEGIFMLRQLIIKNEVNRIMKEEFLQGRLPNMEILTQKVAEEVMNRKFEFIKILKDAYKNLSHDVSLEITGEGYDIQKRVETLTTVYQVLAQKGDPRADEVLRKILALTGENIDALQVSQVGQQPQPPQQSTAMPSGQGGGGARMEMPQGKQPMSV